MKRIWMWSIFATLIASIPFPGWAQSKTRVFTRGTETITVTNITPDSLNAGIGALLVKDGTIYAGTTNYLWISKDTGKTWVKRSREHGLSAWWVNAITAADSSHILASGDDGIFKSTDNGNTWRHVFWAPPYGRIMTFLFVKNGTVFAGGDRIFRSSDNGNTWIEVADHTLTWPYVRRMTQTSAGTILAGISSGVPTSGRGVLRSTDNGGTWTLYDSGFTAYKNIDGLAAHPGGRVYAATEMDGAWYSNNDGLSWQRVEGLSEKLSNEVAVCSSLGVFFGFNISRQDPLYRSSGAGWKPVPGLVGYYVYAIASFDTSSIVVGTSGAIFLVKFTTATGVEDEGIIPSTFTLRQNFPNPFNPTTTIEFLLPKRINVNLSIYNILGQKVETLVNGELVAGTHRIVWNAEHYPSGIYLTRLQTNEFVATKKMLLVK